MSQFAASSHPLVVRLTRLRSRVRAVLAMFGAGVLVASAVGSLFVLITGDYLLHFPSTVRLVLLLAWIAGLAVLAWRFLFAPLMTRLTDQFLASRVENVHAGLSDELISAVNFIEAGTSQNNALASRQIDSAMQRTTSLRFEEAIDFRSSARAVSIAAVIALVVAVIAGMHPQLTHIGLSRWFSASPLDWPRVTRVSFAWDTPDHEAPKVLPIGEQILLRAKVTQGGYAGQRVWLTNWSDHRRASDDLMTFQPGMSGHDDFIYERSLDPEGDSLLSLKLSAGDDTEQEPVSIRLAPRPAVSEMFASITPPPYVKNVMDPSKPAPAVVVDLLTQAAHAVEGASIAIRVKATKPFMLDAHGDPEIRLLDPNKDEEIPLAASRKLVEPDVAEFIFPATKSLQCRLAMRDSDGFENHVGGTLTIEVVPDGLPSVVITEPRRTVERSPTAHVNMSIQATDDLGLDGLKMVAEKFDAKPGDRPLIELPVAWTERTVDPASGNSTGRAEFTWNLATLNLPAGTRLTFYAMVQDNYDLAGKRHPWVKSPSLSLQLRTEDDIAAALRNHLKQVNDRIKALKTQQEQTQAKTNILQKAIASSETTTQQQKNQLGELSQQQNEQAASASAIQQSVEDVRSDLQQNNMADSTLGKLASDVSAGMQDVATNNMPAAASSLSKAQQSAAASDKPTDQAPQAKQTSDAAKDASKQQSDAIAKMNSMIDQLGAAGDFETIKSELSQLQAQQKALDNATKTLANQTIGKTPEQLPQDVRDKLNDAAAKQSTLASKTSDLLNKMDKSATQLSKTDPAASKSLQAASQAGKDDQVNPSQSSASDSMAKNQMQDAGSEQKKAEDGLQKMSDELAKKDQRDDEELAKQLDELIQEVTQLRDAEDALNKTSIAAGPAAGSAVMSKQGDTQGTLQITDNAIEKKAQSTKGAQAAAADIHEAGDHMADSSTALYKNQQPAALTPQTQAIASLNAALLKLQELKDKLAEKMKDKDLAYFIKQYKGIQDDQKTIKAAADAIEARRQASPDKQVDRLAMIQLAKLSAAQAALVDRINVLTADDKLKDFQVVLWMNGQIAESMNYSSDHLKKAQTGTMLASAQQNSIDRMEDIIQALTEEKNKPKEGGESPPGGGPSGPGKPPPLVPPLAQLKLLRAMQVVINNQTANVANGIATAPDNGTKTELQDQAASLGQKQGEIKRIAIKMIQDLQKH
jgi:hypothetical protein